MAFDSSSITVNDAFFQPISGLAQASSHTRPCPEISDDLWIRNGILRVLEESSSGRAFLQQHGSRLETTPKLSNYFSCLHSSRRGDVLNDVVEQILGSVKASDTNRLAHLPELDGYICFAIDMHWHKPATHDQRFDGKKVSVGHSFSLNLRDQGLRHLAAAEGEHEHDMSLMARLKPKGLRQGVPKGQRVLIVYDRAGINYDFWNRCRKESAAYFLSRTKSNMVFALEEVLEWDRSDTRNRGVLHDQWVTTPEGHRVRLIEYRDPETGKEFQFLTNVPDVPPGVLAELYRRRWDVEKVFDEVKNKLVEKKAWASSQEARINQGRLVALTENLLLLYERRVEETHGIRNEAEDRRREKRARQVERIARSAGRQISVVLLRAREATQRSVKLIRWLRSALIHKLTEGTALLDLRRLYATP
jgi:hypothetical protein